MSKYDQQQPKYDERQQIFCLNRASNMAGYFQTGTIDTGTEEELQELVRKRLKKLLSKSKIKKLIGEWQVVWGPVVYQHNKASNVADNCIYIAKYNGISDKDRYIIALSETNALSWYGWLVANSYEDSIPWNNGRPWEKPKSSESKERIGEGSSKVLRILYEEMKYDNKLLLEYLKELMEDYKKGEVLITISGHSQGAVISPLLGLSLMEQPQREQWDPEKKADLRILATSFSTLGNKEFAEYYAKSELKNKTDPILNELDILTNMWNKDELEKNRTIYSSNIEDIEDNELIELFVDLMKKKVDNEDYQRISWEKEPFESEFEKDVDNVKDIFLSPNFTKFTSKMLARLILHLLDIEEYEPKRLNLLASTIEFYLDTRNYLIYLYDEVLFGDYLLWWGLPMIFSWNLARFEGMKSVMEATYGSASSRLGRLELAFLEAIFEQLQYSAKLPPDMAEKLKKFSKNLPELLDYLSQALYQHEIAFIKHFEVSEFFEILRKISEKEKSKCKKFCKAASEPCLVLYSVGYQWIIDN
ncbi:MAG: hypothetical protein F6K14_31995 [Symploca sp. SIO2C1]|nr:hypothetical protein [Symploca sp. SIO2C1]